MKLRYKYRTQIKREYLILKIKKLIYSIKNQILLIVENNFVKFVKKLKQSCQK
jgi:hypothetical protein